MVVYLVEDACNKFQSMKLIFSVMCSELLYFIQENE